MSGAVDIYVLYRIIKDLTTPFEEWEAHKLGLIDADGKKLKSASTSEEKKAMSFYNRFVFNIKRLMAKFGLKSKMATFAAALFLLRESQKDIPGDDLILEGIQHEMDNLKNNDKSFKHLQEEIANVTGAAVAGTGDSGVHWAKNTYKVGQSGDRKRYGRYINGAAFLKRVAREKRKKRNETE